MMIPHCRCGHGEGLTRIVLRLTSSSLSVEAQCGFDVGVPQHLLNDSWRGSGVSERCAESIAESMEASVVSWQAELFQHGQRPNLTTWARFQGRPFRFGSSRPCGF